MDKSTIGIYGDLLECVNGKDGIQRLYKTEDPFLSRQQRPTVYYYHSGGEEGRRKCEHCWSVEIFKVVP